MRGARSHDIERLLSVVIATRNRASRLAECLEALLRYPPPAAWDVEIVVVDNGSVDATRSVVTAAEHARPARAEVHYVLEPRVGKAFAVNAGTAVARGALVAFLDDDVTVDARWMEAVVEAFSRDPTLDLLAGAVLDGDPNGGGVAITFAHESRTLDAGTSLVGLVLGCNLAVRREVLRRVGGRDTRLGPGRGLAFEDIDFVYRVLRAGFRGHFSPLAAVVHRPAPRNRPVELPRGRGAYYFKYVAHGDRTIARHAWWELARLSHDLFGRGGPAVSATLATARHLAVGAVLMAIRMASSTLRRTGG
jgi:GT2 family glycosyltransferase